MDKILKLGTANVNVHLIVLLTGIMGLSRCDTLDPDGHGTTIEDHKRLLKEMGEGVSFQTAFANIYGMSVSQFEADYFDLIKAFIVKKGGHF